MGTRGREIVGMDVDELLKLLNAAYASEWLAYYQYWLGAKIIKGPMKDARGRGTEPARHRGTRPRGAPLGPHHPAGRHAGR